MNKNILRLLILSAACSANFLSANSYAQVFSSTIEGSSENPEVCSLVFIQACDDAVAKCNAHNAAGGTQLQCDLGCEESEVRPIADVGDEHSCRVTADLVAPLKPADKIVDQSSRFASTKYASADDCQSALSDLRSGAPSFLAFSGPNTVSVQSDCNGSVLEVRFTPNASTLSADSNSHVDLYFDSINSRSKCEAAMNVYLNLHSDQVLISQGEGCKDLDSDSWFSADYTFSVDVNFTNLFK